MLHFIAWKTVMRSLDGILPSFFLSNASKASLKWASVSSDSRSACRSSGRPGAGQPPTWVCRGERRARKVHVRAPFREVALHRLTPGRPPSGQAISAPRNTAHALHRASRYSRDCSRRAGPLTISTRQRIEMDQKMKRVARAPLPTKFKIISGLAPRLFAHSLFGH